MFDWFKVEIYFKNTVENIYKIEKRIEKKDIFILFKIRSKKKKRCRINDLPTVVQFTDEIWCR